MSGSFFLKYYNDKQEYISHQFLFSLNPEIKKQKLAPLRELYRKKQLQIFCCCSNPKPVMILVYRSTSDSFFIRSKERAAHNKSCIYSKQEQYSTASVYESGFINKPDGTIDVKLDPQDYRLTTKGKSINTDSINLPNNSDGHLQSQNIAIATQKPTLYALAMRLLTSAWNDLVQYAHYKHTRYPSADKSEIFKQLLFTTIKGYSVGKHKLADILYRGEAEGKVAIIEKQHKTSAFCMLLLEDDGIKNQGDQYTLHLSNPINKKFCQIQIENYKFDSAKQAIRNIKGPYLIVGFLESPSYKKAQFVNMALLPINDYGVPIESSYERTLYNQLCSDKRAVVRHTTSTNPVFNGYVPDGMLIDTEVKTILEVFGISSDHEDYHIQREIKIKHFKSLKPKYDFWYWDAYQRDAMPLIPNKKASNV